MIKTTIIPERNSCLIQIPNSYIGKELEILIYAKDELTISSKSNNKTMKDYLGAISNETAISMHEEVKTSRDSWEERLKKQF